jgi:hypothetical protein
MPNIVNLDLLQTRLGATPSFHDAEIQALRLDSGQRSTGEPCLELEVHVFAVESSDRGVSFVNHTLVTLEFRGAEDLALSEFGSQNVLFDIDLRDIHARGDSRARVGVELVASTGVTGQLRCREVAVTAAVPFEPGPHSVYCG